MNNYIGENTEDYYNEFNELEEAKTIDDLFCSQLGSKKFLAVITNNGQLILDAHPYESLMRVVEYVGVDEVASLNLKVHNDLPFMSKNPTSFNYGKNDYKLSEDGWYIYTAMNLKGKVALIEKIGELTGYKFTGAIKRIII